MGPAANVALHFVDAEYDTATSVIMGSSASLGRRTPTGDIDCERLPRTVREGLGLAAPGAAISHH
jgi:hypothetical protein